MSLSSKRKDHYLRQGSQKSHQILQKWASPFFGAWSTGIKWICLEIWDRTACSNPLPHAPGAVVTQTPSFFQNFHHHPIACGLPATVPRARRKHTRQTHKYAKWMPALAEKVSSDPSKSGSNQTKNVPKARLLHWRVFLFLVVVHWLAWWLSEPAPLVDGWGVNVKHAKTFQNEDKCAKKPQHSLQDVPGCRRSDSNPSQTTRKPPLAPKLDTKSN